MTQIYGDQPTSTSDMWNRLEYRPLEGFVYAITRLTYSYCPIFLQAMMGNVVVWKPSDSQIFSAQIIIEV
jgi:1-pyrroline-5-carboxylate dehydrogenase